jgi:hypothetical protein
MASIQCCTELHFMFIARLCYLRLPENRFCFGLGYRINSFNRTGRDSRLLGSYIRDLGSSPDIRSVSLCSRDEQPKVIFPFTLALLLWVKGKNCILHRLSLTAVPFVESWLSI